MIELCQKDIYDEDVVNDTFLRIYDNILYGGIDIEHFRSYFMRAYFTNLIQGNIRDKRYSSISPYYDREDTSDYDPEIDLAQKQLEEDIFTYVYQRYQVHEFELFKMYVCLKPAVNYAALSELTKLKVHQIQFIVSKIKKDICRNREFTVRRRALVS